jgi:cytochrome c oxidase assembly protein Cox11
MKSLFVSKEVLKTIVTIVVNLSLTLIPLYGIDCLQTKSGSAYKRYIVKLNSVKLALISEIITIFNGDKF